MKILLVNPPTPHIEKPTIPPLGLAYIASILEKYGFNVRIIDLDLERDNIPKFRWILTDFRPQYIGFTALTPQITYTYALAQIAKKISKDTVCVLGGAHPSAMPRRCLEEERSIDFVVIGEGEYTCLDLLKNEHDKEKVKGIAYKTNNEIFFTEPRAPTWNLDDIPLPARHLLKTDKYAGLPPIKKRPSTHMIASRGCPYNCVFCSEKAVFGRNHRRRNPKKVVDEMELLVNEYGIKEIAFYDDLFTLNKNWVEAISEEIMLRGLHKELVWKVLSRVDTVDTNLLINMKTAGCWLIYYGFESGSQRILNMMRKGTTVQQNIHAAITTKNAGIKIYGFFMLGNLGETKETALQTICLAKKIDPDYFQFTIVRPDPGSDLYNMFVDELERKRISWNDYYAFPSKRLKMPVVGTKLSENELLELRRMAYLALDKRGLLRRFSDGDIKTFKNFRLTEIKNLSDIISEVRIRNIKKTKERDLK